MTKISLTPVIDVVFILLIFFMLASNFNKVGQLEMNTSKESNQIKNDDMKVIKLLVRQDETVISEGKIYDDKELISMIQLAIKNTENYNIIITAKDNVTYQRYLDIMSFLKANGLNNVSIGIKDNEVNINRKLNIHRARLSKFKKSKLNGEMIFQDDEQRIYKLNNGKKVYL